MTIRTRLATTPRTRWLAPVFAVAAAIAVAIAFAPFNTADASDHLIQSEPHHGAYVAEAPHQLVLTFDSPLAQLIGAHHVEVTDSSGYRVDDGHPQIATYSQRTLIVPISAHGEGALEVNYSVRLIGDGEDLQVRSSYQFTVDHSAGPIEGDEISAPATAKGSQPIVLWTFAILFGIAAAGAMVYFLRMATGNSRSSLEPTNRSVFRD